MEASTAKPSLILLVGMHRSGTSLLGSLLPPLGVAVPGELLGGDAHNPEGYHERADITALQEQLLMDLGRWWPGASGTLALPDNWLELACSLRARQALRSILRSEQERQLSVWAIKDPRTSLLLPLWRAVCAELELPLRLVHAIRSPREVVASLLHRDGAAAGMTARRAWQLWQHHNAAVRRDGAGLPRLEVHYSRWFGPGATEQLRELSWFCRGQMQTEEQCQNALGQIHPQHRRSRSHRQQTRRLWRRLDEALQPACRQAPLLPPKPLPRRCRLQVVGFGATPCHWSVHAWLQRCELPAGFELSEAPDATAVGLHLQPVARSRETGDLHQLRHCSLVLDPDWHRVEELRAEGIRAYWIDAHAQVNGWLREGFSRRKAAERLGLPDPQALGQAGTVLCLGSAGAAWDRDLQPPIWGLPGFERLHVADAAAARLLAGWLNAVQLAGLQLVRLQPSDYERACQPYRALQQPAAERLRAQALQWCEALLLDAPLDLRALQAELEWHWQGCPPPSAVHTPSPELEALWQNGAGGASAAVCISLYNYGSRIEAALDSVLRQTHAALELIVVDDGSSDGGPALVQAWMAQHHQRFSRSLLLRHRHNAGLAAARNSAFAAATAPWCFVLDADNTLEPQAVEHCLALAQASDANTAVVHPLVELREDSPLPQGPGLLGGVSWQRHALLQGNQIDAMALIRRSHWQQVGGYSHLPAGWEDYDFWCKLIEAGLHGVVCPQRLAVYNRHAGSMQSDTTLANLRPLQRLLQARHPWLEFKPCP